jgi:AraC family transcriptional regulator, regulatory protein of adaptative response / DNA-3-methyladenine glycosylase II
VGTAREAIAARARRIGPSRQSVICPDPFDPAWLLGFLRARAIPGVEVVGDRSYERVALTPAGTAVFRLTFRPAGRSFLIRSGSSPSVPRPMRERLIRRMFDLDRDLVDFRRLVARDPTLRPLRDHNVVRRPLITDPFEGALRAIIGQQVSVAAARTLLGRIVARFGAPVLSGPSKADPEWRAFPTPERLAEIGVSSLKKLGMVGARAGTIVTVAKASLDGTLDWSRLEELPGDAAQRELESIPGIGPWTASYLRMRVLGDPDAFPGTDLGVIRAMERLGVPRNRIVATAERWRPWRAYVVMLLWAS